MPIPARLLRVYAENLPGARHRPTEKECELETRILDAATTLMARFGRMDFTMGNFALALRLAPITLRRHFPDPDTILAEILYRHLSAIAAAIGQAVPNGAEDPKAARRRAYVTATRTPYNAPTERHLLLMRERHVLPPDLLQPIEDLRLQIGDMIAAPHAEAALALLDTPTLQPDQIEAMLAGLSPRPALRPAQPHRAAKPAKPPHRAHKFRPQAAAPGSHARLMDVLARTTTLVPPPCPEGADTNPPLMASPPDPGG